MAPSKLDMQVEGRLSKLETNYNSLDQKITEIKDNHLKHLDAKMDKIQWLLVTTLITLLIGFVMKWLG